jgi:hypothetical protein
MPALSPAKNFACDMILDLLVVSEGKKVVRGQRNNVEAKLSENQQFGGVLGVRLI